MNPPPRKCLMKFSCKNKDVKMQFCLWIENKWKNARQTCIIWDHEDVCRESPPIFIEISGA
jgi:hypothetical protein